MAGAAGVCEECKINPSKYKCPGCSIRSCSLDCVKAHKQRTDCTGKRPQTEFIPLSQFNDNVLLSDYNMLEDVKRVAESAERMRSRLCGNYYFELPLPLRNLQKAARKRKTTLLFLPSGMTKRETNQTVYHPKKKRISWTIEWRFHSTDVTLIDHGVDEKSTFCSVIENHLKPGPSSHQLKQFCLEPLESLKLFIRKHPKGAKSPFRQLDIKSSIRKQLAWLVILEYPVIHVFLPTQSYNFKVTKRRIPPKVERKEPVIPEQPSPKGLFFREEEIPDDDSSPGPCILDLMKHAKPDGEQVPHQDEQSERIPTKTLNNTQLASVTECSEIAKKESISQEQIDLHSNANSKELGAMDFDFEFGEESIDAYSDFILGPNPGEFLDFEGIFSHDMQMEEIEGQFVSDGIVPEELEEGEIPRY